MTDEQDGAPGAPPAHLLDDETIESLVRDDAVDERHASLAAFAQQVRAAGDRPPPAPTPALRALLAGTAADRPTRRRGLLVARVAGLGLTAKVALATSVAAAVGGAGAAGVLPRDANRVVRDTIEAITPIEIDEGTGDPGGRSPTAPGGAPDGTGSDPQHPAAPGRSGGSDTNAPASPSARAGEGPIDDQRAPGGPGSTRVDRAGDTPAAPVPGPPTDAADTTAPGPTTTAAPPTPPSAVLPTPSSTVPSAPPSTDPLSTFGRRGAPDE